MDNTIEKVDSSNENAFVFGLDIGTRNVVGTVGQMIDGVFHVFFEVTRQHKTRAMLDGQIHNINRVAEVIAEVKEELESKVGFPLTKVCIAAAGRVLVTETTHVEYKYEEETHVTNEDLYTLDLLGIDKAKQQIADKGDNKYKYYCVGHSVMKYYLNGDIFASLEGHKAEEIAEDIIVTFLPEDVIDGLYLAVERVGLEVANLTLEPIAAMNVAIPEMYRMLNIALVDVGAGTSDLCITKDGSIVSYGMIPYAGDELTEIIVQAYLVDFAMAEKIKIDSTKGDSVEYTDIMGINHQLKSEEVWDLLSETRDKIAAMVSDKIKELNGDKSVAAVFVVGGGGKVHGFCESLSKDLGIMPERVALRGEESMKDIVFEDEKIEKDPLIVTPLGICLNYFEQRNSFIMVHLNGEMIKMYDNGKLTIFDAAIQAGFLSEELFPRRGKELNISVNGIKRLIRGKDGESAIIKVNGEIQGLNAPLKRDSDIEIIKSTVGEKAHAKVSDLDEYTSSTVTFTVNKKPVNCPRFVEVNGSLVSEDYELSDNDKVDTRNYYTVGQLIKFMDIEIDPHGDILVNNRVASEDTLIYENFSIDIDTIPFASMDDGKEGKSIEVSNQNSDAENLEEKESISDKEEHLENNNAISNEKEEEYENEMEHGVEESVSAKEKDKYNNIVISINGESYTLSGKDKYVFVDIFTVYYFNTKDAKGRFVLTKVNDEVCGYTTPIKDGDKIYIGWRD